MPEDGAEGRRHGAPQQAGAGPLLAAPPGCVGAHVAPRLQLRLVFVPWKNLSPRGDIIQKHSRLCGAENTREKRALRQAKSAGENSLPEGEIVAIVTDIELDIISITIVIISTIITAVSTAASRHRCNI